MTKFIPMIIDYTMCDICYKLGKLEGTELLLERARACFKAGGRENWGICNGTLLLDIFVNVIPNSGLTRM